MKKQNEWIADKYDRINLTEPKAENERSTSGAAAALEEEPRETECQGNQGRKQNRKVTQKREANVPGAHEGSPAKPQGFVGERSGIAVSEFSRLRGNKGYEDCGDEA